MAHDGAAVTRLQGAVGNADAVEGVGEAHRQLGPGAPRQVVPGRNVVVGLKPTVHGQRPLGTHEGEFVVAVDQHAGVPQELLEQAEEDVGQARLGQMHQIVGVGADQVDGLGHEVGLVFDEDAVHRDGGVRMGSHSSGPRRAKRLPISSTWVCSRVW